MARHIVYVACGSAAASANLVKSRLAELLKKEGFNAELVTMRISEVKQIVKARKPDLVVITAGSVEMLKKQLPEDVPVVSGLPLMTMIGAADFINTIRSFF